MTKNISSGELRALVIAQELSGIVGAVESLDIDFKAIPYRLEEERQKYELAKDVAAFANAAGGLILIGVPTERSKTQPTDVALVPRPIRSGMVIPQQYLDILASWIYPPLDNLTVSSYLIRDHPGHELVLIEIPPQAKSKGPFIVTRVVGENAERPEGVLVGYFERRGASSHALLPSEVHALLRDGRLFREAIDQRASIQAATHPASVVQESPPDAREGHRPPTSLGKPELRRVRNRLATLISSMGLEADPTFALAATPFPDTSIPGLFASEDDEVVNLLRKPPEIRTMGFDLDTGEYPKITNGQSRLAFLPGYKGVELYRDGLLTFAATASEDFLSWGERAPDAPLVVNPVPLIEVILLFCTLAGAVYSVADPVPKAIGYHLFLRRMCIGGKGPRFFGGEVGRWRDYRFHEGPCEADIQIVETNGSDAGASALRLVREVYTLFGITYDQIPYATDDRIDPDAFKRMG